MQKFLINIKLFLEIYQIVCQNDNLQPGTSYFENFFYDRGRLSLVVSCEKAADILYRYENGMSHRWRGKKE